MKLNKSLVILQSNYIPWKGYFDLMAAADEFIIFDEAQFTKNDWRNRNRIIINGKVSWLTIAVRTSGVLGAPIESIDVVDGGWARAHWDTIKQCYRKTPYFTVIAPVLEPLYNGVAHIQKLSEINELFLRALANTLEIQTVISHSNSVPRTTDDPTSRLIEICRARGATTYISGPAAKAYLDKAKFDAVGIDLKFADYSGYPVYDQGTAAFEHGVSIIDLLMQCGPAARAQLKSFSNRQSFLQES